MQKNGSNNRIFDTLDMYKPCKDREASRKLNWQLYYKDKREFERMASLSLMQDEELAKDVTLYPTLYDKPDKG